MRRTRNAKIIAKLGPASSKGAKLRLGTLTGGRAQLTAGERFRLDLDPAAGDARRAPLPHPEIFAAVTADHPGTEERGKKDQCRSHRDGSGHGYVGNALAVLVRPS